MRLGIVGGLIVAFGPSLAFSSDYDVSTSDSFADAIAAANRNTDGDTFEISGSGATAIPARSAKRRRLPATRRQNSPEI